ncbi:MAG: hypothetical protein HOV83_11950 [Catenulispora sp.]|nr:hypothetical protein [Catenulispora sp.]
MDLGTMLRVMIKRWYVSVPALLMAIALPAAAWFAVPPKYTSTSTISLLNSQAASSGTGRTGNPFTAFDNSLTGLADYLARTLDSDQSMADLATKHGVTDLAAAELAPNASGPFITLTITGQDPDRILTEMQAFDQFAIDQLAAIQTNTSDALKAPLPANVLVRAIVMVAPQKPVASMKSKLEDVAGAGVGGMVILFLAVFGSEALAVKRGKPPTVPRRAGVGARASVPAQQTPIAPTAPTAVPVAASAPATTEPPPTLRRRSTTSARPATTTANAAADTPTPATSEPTGSLARRASSVAPAPLETTISLPRYREGTQDSDTEEETATESWFDSDSDSGLESLRDIAVGDRDPGSR